MGQLHAVCMAVFVLCGRSGRAEDEDLLSAAGTGAAKGCHVLPDGERTQSLAVTGRGQEGELPRPLENDTLPMPHAPSSTPQPPRGTFPHMLTSAAAGSPAVPGYLDKAGPGKHRGWLQDGQ